MISMRDIFRSHAVLDAEGRHVNGSDKETNHRYGDAYEGLFATGPLYHVGTRSLRESITLMMEVGIADGSSLLAWQDIFPNALCVGLDIHHSDRAHGPRIEFHLGDQRSKEDCERAAGGRQFDLIVEDATHRLEDNLVTLFYLWPFVRRGGLYVIEEFANVGALRVNVEALFPSARIVGTCGPTGQDEPLVVLRKP